MKTAPARKRTTKKSAPAPAPIDRKQETALKLWVVLAKAFDSVLKHVETDVANYDLTATEFGILEALYHKGPMLLGEIQRKMLVTSGGITYLVDRLVDKGLVKREHCEDDRRARYAVLTTSGTALIRKSFPTHAARIEQLMAGLTSAEQREATALLRKLGLAAAALSEDSE